MRQSCDPDRADFIHTQWNSKVLGLLEQRQETGVEVNKRFVIWFPHKREEFLFDCGEDARN